MNKCCNFNEFSISDQNNIFFIFHFQVYEKNQIKLCVRLKKRKLKYPYIMPMKCYKII